MGSCGWRREGSTALFHIKSGLRFSISLPSKGWGPSAFPLPSCTLPLHLLCEDQCSSKPQWSHYPSRKVLHWASSFRLERQKAKLTSKQRQAGKNNWFHYILSIHMVLLWLHRKTNWVCDLLKKLISHHQSSKLWTNSTKASGGGLEERV